MRLIDLDQTVIFTITDETQGGMQYEVQMTVAEVFDKFFNGVPEIIDAIPVEWMKQQFYDNPKSPWANACRDVYTKWLRWLRWQKEQGVHGT